MDNNMLLILIFVLPIGIGIWWFIKRKKKNATAKIDYQKRRQDDEVWRTIKDYLKSKGVVGREIVECYVAKRLDEDVVDKKLTKEEQKKRKQEITDRKKAETEKKKELKSKGLKYRKELPKDLYVALFVTRNAKTKVEDEPRAIECSVITEKINKKETSRKIVVLRSLDYKEEHAWIYPIKKKEEDEINKIANKKVSSQNRMKKLKSIVGLEKKQASEAEEAKSNNKKQKVQKKNEKK